MPAHRYGYVYYVKICDEQNKPLSRRLTYQKRNYFSTIIYFIFWGDSGTDRVTRVLFDFAAITRCHRVGKRLGGGRQCRVVWNRRMKRVCDRIDCRRWGTSIAEGHRGAIELNFYRPTTTMIYGFFELSSFNRQKKKKNSNQTRSIRVSRQISGFDVLNQNARKFAYRNFRDI